MNALVVLLIAGSFFIGSIPFGVLFARKGGVNLRDAGSGNIGATNVLRSVGKKEAVLTLLGDLLKGTSAVAAGKALGVGPLYEGAMGLAAVVGHDFSLFLRFRGGKGVATSIGVMVIYAALAGFITVLVWLAPVAATVAVTRISSLGALTAFALLPVLVAAFGYGGEKLVFSVIISALLMVKHRENIKRLFQGTEGRIGERA
jgi:glycerol-3-phosphate acyltransferase PlsY